MSKAGRKKSYTAPYYPFYIEPTPELEYLENMYKEKGFFIYHRLLMLVAKTYMHVVPYKSDYDIQTLRFYVNMEYELVDDCIKYLVHRDFIDKELFNEGKIWIPYLIRELSGLYSNRRHDPPQKVGLDIITTCSNTQLVSELPSELPSDVVIENTTTDIGKVKTSSLVSKEDIDHFKDLYPDLDIDGSFTKLKKQNSNPTPDDLARWLANGYSKGMDKKRTEWTTYKTGNIKVYCSKCGVRDVVSNKYGAENEMSNCCKAEYVPEPYATIEQG